MLQEYNNKDNLPLLLQTLIAYNINKPEAIFLCINLLRSLNSVPRIIS